MEANFQVFINYEQIDWAKLFLMTKFAYNNTKNVSINHMFFEFNFSYNIYVFYKKNLHPCFKLKVVDKLASQLKELMTLYQENLCNAQEFQK